MSDVYDLVVIGAGIGGLTTAALAARDGYETLLLEAHNRPGGCAGDFALNGVLFPAGATLLSGFEPRGLHSWVYRRLGIEHCAVALDQAMEIVSPSRRFTLWTDRRRWASEVARTFTANRPAQQHFLDWARRVGGVVHGMASRFPVLPPRAPRDVLRLAAALRPDAVHTLPFLMQTVGGVMHRLGADHDPAFRRFIDAQLLDATGCEAHDCAAVNGAIALDLYHRGCFALPGGPAEIARDLLRSLRRDGGTVRFRMAVVALRRGGDGVWMIRTADGSIVRARCVVSNVPAWDMPALLGEQTPPRLLRAIGLRRCGWGAFVMHAAVEASALPRAPHAYFQTLPPPGRLLTEGGMCFITLMPPSARPGAPRAVSVSTHTSIKRWWGQDRDTYQLQKEQYTERLLDACELAVPGFREGVVFRRAATPRSFAHYTLRGHGVVGGVRNDRRHALLGAQSYRSGVPGLYLCGDSVFPGQGTIGVTLSGINAWRSVRDDLGARRSTAGERAHTLARLDPGDSRSTRRITPDAERGARVA